MALHGALVRVETGFHGALLLELQAEHASALEALAEVEVLVAAEGLL